MAKRRVFISWSGKRSQYIASKFHEWLPSVLQQVDPWMSQEDIDRGAHWVVTLASELDKAEYGIVCVTPENVNAPWLNFEAGAISKKFEAARVCPYVVGMSKAELTGPLSTLNAADSTRDDMLRLVRTLNRTLADDHLQDAQLVKAFERAWPDWESVLRDLPSESKTTPRRDEGDLLAEILETVRRIEHSQVAADLQSEALRSAQWFRGGFQAGPNDEWVKLRTAVPTDPAAARRAELARKINQGRKKGDREPDKG